MNIQEDIIEESETSIRIKIDEHIFNFLKNIHKIIETTYISYFENYRIVNINNVNVKQIKTISKTINSLIFIHDKFFPYKYTVATETPVICDLNLLDIETIIIRYVLVKFDNYRISLEYNTTSTGISFYITGEVEYDIYDETIENKLFEQLYELLKPIWSEINIE